MILYCEKLDEIILYAGAVDDGALKKCHIFSDPILLDDATFDDNDWVFVGWL